MDVYAFIYIDVVYNINHNLNLILYFVGVFYVIQEMRKAKKAISFLDGFCDEDDEDDDDEDDDDERDDH